jgi:hypothetical protein
VQVRGRDAFRSPRFSRLAPLSQPLLIPLDGISRPRMLGAVAEIFRNDAPDSVLIASKNAELASYSTNVRTKKTCLGYDLESLPVYVAFLSLDTGENYWKLS